MHLVRHHSHWGAFLAEVEGGRIVGVRPFERDPDPSPLIDAIPQSVHSQARIAQPMVREGWLKHGRGRGEGRGREPFVPVSWDRALDLVASEIDRVRREHGNAAIMGGSQGWSSAGIFHEARGQLHRFFAAAGGYTDQVMNYSFGAALAFLPHILGSPQAVVGPLTSWSSIARHSKLLVLFGGANPKNTQVSKGGCASHSTGPWIDELARAGVEVINISPIREDGPEPVRPQWLPIRPNTDTALLLALTHTLISENLHDRAFLERHCEGFERVRPYLMGESDGTPKSADWAAPITGIPADTIRALARRMTKTRTMLTAAWSLQRAHHGEQPYWAMVLLASALGQIGLPGGGFGFGYGSGAGIGDPPLAFAAPAMEGIKNPINVTIPTARISDCLLNPGAPFDFNGKRSQYPDIRLVYWAGGNPFHHHQDTNKLRRAFTRPETVVVHEPWWTATARHADIVLPATTSLERNDIGGARRDNFIIAMHRAIAPVGEARDDFAIFSALAERLGFAEAYTKGRDENAWLRQLYEQCRHSAGANAAAVPDFDTFWSQGYLEIPAVTDEYVLFADFRADQPTKQDRSLWDELRRLSGARIGLPRAGASLASAPLLEFKLAHARARDAVHDELDAAQLAADLASLGDVIVVDSAAEDRQRYLMRPDLGRRLAPDAEAKLAPYAARYDCTFVIADGLSARAVQRHAQPVLARTIKALRAEGSKIGPLVIVRHGRVAVGDAIASLLGSDSVAVLIGERPGLTAPDSMGAYLTWQPHPGTTDADRNCISNIRPDGIPYADAAFKLAHLLRAMRARRISGVQLKDDSDQAQVQATITNKT